MLQQIIQINFPTVFAVALTYMLIYKDRAFNMKVRIAFYVLLDVSVLLIVVNALCEAGIFGVTGGINVMNFFKLLLRPVILMIWLLVILRKESYRKYVWLVIPVAVNVLVCATNFLTHWMFVVDENGVWHGGFLYPMPLAIFLVYLVLIVVLSVRNAGIDDKMEYVVIFTIVSIIVIMSVVEFYLKCSQVMDNVFAISICVYFFYLVMQVYKRDALTNLMNRHNLVYDLEELVRKEYLISIIDVDNFKMINDKYGHEKGDEVLRHVVDTIRFYLPKKSRLYRFGGDEFAIISKSADDEELAEAFVKINKSLETDSYRISVGTYLHKPDEDVWDALDVADKAMYENKRKLKSEDIWDDMTGLYNLRGFSDELTLMKKKAEREKKDICLVAFDIEHLGNINLAYGYAEGNMLIMALATIIKNSLDTQEFAGHLGSDEFVAALLIRKEEEEYQKNMIEKVLAAVRHAQVLDNKEYTIEVNAVAYVIPEDEDPDESINEVLSLKQGKKENRRKASYSYTHGDQDVNREEEALAMDILDNNRLKYALQPIVSAKDGEIVAYEALMRSDTDPMISPLTLLRHAYNNRRDYDIEKLTFLNVLDRISKEPAIIEDKQIFINSIPGFILDDKDYALLREKYGHILKNIVIEITEQSELKDEELMLIQKRQEQDGYMVAIDDYGSGNSNTFSLLRIKPQIIKLDRLLISDIDTNTKKQYFVNSIITFAKENGMKVLAEGVETEAELKMVIRLQVDYIQGYYTARPSYETIMEIDEEIKRAIVNENIRGVVEGKRKIYVASNGWELSLVQIALEEYTGITVSTPNLKILGNSDYVADLYIKVMDGLDCILTLKDVRLNTVDDLPCIDIGEGAHVTLMIEGNCTIDHKGIHVPEGSSLTIKGSGNLSVSTKGHECYGIGCGMDESIGDIIFNHSGLVSVKVDGEQCAAIGGGMYKYGRGICILSGQFDINVASVDAVGIGCFHGDVPIVINDCAMDVLFRVNTGSAIGSIHGSQSIEFKNFDLKISGSGSKLSGIGCNNRSTGVISMDSGTFSIHMSGQEICLLGTRSGNLSYSARHVKMDIKGEGDSIMAIGSMDKTGSIRLKETTGTIVINSAQPMAYGAGEDNIFIMGIRPVLHINE